MFDTLRLPPNREGFFVFGNKPQYKGPEALIENPDCAPRRLPVVKRTTKRQDNSSVGNFVVEGNIIGMDYGQTEAQVL